MNWTMALRDLGLAVPKSPDLNAILFAVVFVIGAWWAGWWIGHRAAPQITSCLYRWMGRTEGVSNKLTGSTIQFALTALALLILGNASVLNPIAAMIVAIGLGLAVGILALTLTRAAGLGVITAAIVAVAALVGTTAGSLGGMQPLIAGLDGVGFAVGHRRLSLLSAISFVVVIAVMLVVARVANRILMHSIEQATRLDRSQRALAQKLAGIGVVVVTGLLGFDLLGIDLTALKFFSGAFGLAVGFGLQKTFGNLIAGVILLLDRSVKPGDVIVVGDTFGAVNKIGVRAVSVVTRDGKEHLIPNEQLMTSPVENWSYSSRNVRVHIPVGVAYGSDLALAQRLMMEAASASKRVLADPKPSVWLKGFGESAVNHDILLWICDPEMGVGNVRSEVLNHLWVSFAEHGIELPYPQRDIHIRSMPPATP